METKTSKRQTTIRYLVASFLFLVVAIRFFTMGDEIGTVIYSAATVLALLTAGVQLLKKP